VLFAVGRSTRLRLRLVPRSDMSLLASAEKPMIRSPALHARPKYHPPNITANYSGGLFSDWTTTQYDQPLCIGYRSTYHGHRGTSSPLFHQKKNNNFEFHSRLFNISWIVSREGAKDGEVSLARQNILVCIILKHPLPLPLGSSCKWPCYHTVLMITILLVHFHSIHKYHQ